MSELLLTAGVFVLMAPASVVAEGRRGGPL
jgi:hypothetical protein